ncbi:MAG: hypothetical protein KAT17_06660 [Candidatus Aminicenantes bacterium]|nr:hypothetical protein [Candidatus Aminicenantes bacterium]
MKKLFIMIIIVSVLSLPGISTEIMKLSDIKPGMKGIGKTIFKGSKIETFTFKVLGFLEKFVPDKDLIWVELESPAFEGSGVVAGMSGSPLYIDGKIIGAVSYGFRFSKKPLAGVTPIEDIIKTSEYNNQTFTIDISNFQIDFGKQNVNAISKIIQAELINRSNFSPVKDIIPIKLISSYKGIDQSALGLLKPIFTPMGSLKISSQIKDEGVKPDFFKISSADAATIPLIKGDFEYKVSGTVTHVDGNKVYLFGHPFFNLGLVNFPLHRGEVVAVVPSYQSSFRLTSSRQMVGTVVQDRFSAVQAELGRSPYMIPLKVFLKNRNRKFEIEMVSHPLLTPVLSSISLTNIFMSEYQQYGFNSIKVNGKIFIENERNVIISDIFSGSSSFAEFSNLILAINFFLMNNKEKPIKIQKMDFEITGAETIRRTNIENVIINKNIYSPGEIIDIRLFLGNERGNYIKEQVKIKAPNLKPGSIFFLMVADKNELLKFDSKNIKTNYFPTKLNSLIRAINNLRKNNRIYFKITVPAQGLFIQGYEYSNLPLSLRHVFMFNSTSMGQSEIKYSTLMEYQMEIPAVVSGLKIFKLQIKER